MTRLRIFIADDHAIVREGLRSLLATEPDLELVGEANDGVQAVDKVRALKPDVILLDLMMPRMDGVEAITEIKKDWQDARIIILTSFSDDEKVFSAIRSGALGYLLKESSPDELLKAIYSVSRGEGFLSPGIASKVMREINQPPKLPPTKDPLTERENEILQLVAQGLTNDQIAEKLVVSERTVRTHVSNILAKLQLANRTQAALYALKEGLASL
ncbi:MAG: DNA-binding response regulator [Anaerolineales bacterium]|nr:response regulator transcription factor [Anaerolineae bacterium]PWB72749.1 MAG: DNA-binding response regulator [Anaerolineales bacterium]